MVIQTNIAPSRDTYHILAFCPPFCVVNDLQILLQCLFSLRLVIWCGHFNFSCQNAHEYLENIKQFFTPLASNDIEIGKWQYYYAANCVPVLTFSMRDSILTQLILEMLGWNVCVYQPFSVSIKSVCCVM